MQRDGDDDAHGKKGHPRDGDALTRKAFRRRPRLHEQKLAAAAGSCGYVQESFALGTLFFHRLPALICLHDELLSDHELWICGTDPHPTPVPAGDGTAWRTRAKR